MGGKESFSLDPYYLTVPSVTEKLYVLVGLPSLESTRSPFVSLPSYIYSFLYIHTYVRSFATRTTSATRIQLDTTRCSESIHDMLSRLVLFAFLLLPIAAQEIGVDLCACQPAVYSVRLQLNLTCADATVTAGLAGIRDITCIVDKSTDANVTDFQPTIVNEIQFLETDQNGNIVQQNLFADGYVEGDIVEYTSFLLGESSDINAVSLPSALSVFVTAQNAAGEPIINTWAIQFNNDCSVHPVLTVGQRIGWTVFVSEILDCFKEKDSFLYYVLASSLSFSLFFVFPRMNSRSLRLCPSCAQ